MMHHRGVVVLQGQHEPYSKRVVKPRPTHELAAKANGTINSPSTHRETPRLAVTARWVAPFLVSSELLKLRLVCRETAYAYTAHIHSIALGTPRNTPRTPHTTPINDTLPRLLAHMTGLKRLRVKDTHTLRVLTSVDTWKPAQALKELSLWRIGKKEKDAAAVAHVITSHTLPSLTTLDLADTCVSAQGMTLIMQALQVGCPLLKQLDMRSSYGVVGGEEAREHEAVGRALAITLEARRSLRWDGMQVLRMGASGRGMLDCWPCGLAGALQTLVELDMFHSALTDTHLKALGEGLRRLKAPAMESLRVGGANLSVGSADALMDALRCGATPRLHTLRVESCGLTTAGVAALSVALRTRVCTQLADVMLMHAGLTTEHMAQLCDGLTHVGGLRSLCLARNDLGQTGAQELAVRIARGAMPHLERLDMTHTLIGDAGVTCVVRGLAVSPIIRPIKTLNLSGCGLGVNGVTEVTQGLRRGVLPYVEVLDLSLNPLGDGAVKALATGLQKGGGKQLRCLLLNYTDMGPDGGCALASALASSPGVCPTLSSLHILQWAAQRAVGTDAYVPPLQKALRGRGGVLFFE